MSSTRMDDPQPDPRLAAALRASEGEPPTGAVDWEALRGSIRARAELPLARRRRPGGAARAVRRGVLPVVSLVAAASVALVVWLGRAEPGPEPQVGAVAEWEVSAEEALQADVSDQEFRALVSGRAAAEQLLWLAVDDG